MLISHLGARHPPNNLAMPQYLLPTWVPAIGARLPALHLVKGGEQQAVAALAALERLHSHG